MSNRCQICGDVRPRSLEEHHILPRRFGGSDHEANLITLCASCHRALESIYDKRFWSSVGVRPSEASRGKQLKLQANNSPGVSVEDGDGTSEQIPEAKRDELIMDYRDERIRDLVQAGVMQKHIAEAFNLTQARISDIANGRD
jgi:predicted XRE-type DNA-binding protein